MGVSSGYSDPAVLESIDLALAVREDVAEHSEEVLFGLDVSLHLLVKLGVPGVGVGVDRSPSGEDLEVSGGDVLSAESASSIGAHLVKLVDKLAVQLDTPRDFFIRGIFLGKSSYKAFLFVEVI